MKNVFTTGQIATMLHVAPRTVTKWTDSGALKCYKVPKTRDRRIKKSDLIKFLKEHDVEIPRELGRTQGFLLVGKQKIDGLDFVKHVALDWFSTGMIVKEFDPMCIIVHCSIGYSLDFIKNYREELKSSFIIAIINEDSSMEEYYKAGYNYVLPSSYNPLELQKCILGSVLEYEQFQPRKASY